MNKYLKYALYAVAAYFLYCKFFHKNQVEEKQPLSMKETVNKSVAAQLKSALMSRL